MRPNTERPITVLEGTNIIVGEALARAETLVDEIFAGRHKPGGSIPLWDDHAAERIVAVLLEKWGSR